LASARVDGVRGENLAETVGFILGVERARARLSQARLAERLGVSQQWLSRVERGEANASFATVQRIFAELGKQLRVEAVPVGTDMDHDINRGIVRTEEDRCGDVGIYGTLLHRLTGVPHAVTGRLAAFAQGAPIPSPLWIDIVVAAKDLDSLAAITEQTFCMRWSQRWEDWGYGSTDPREPGAPRWKIYLCDMRLQIVDELPQTIEVRVGEQPLRVVPIADIERDDPWLHRLMNRWRQRRETTP